MAVEFHNAAEIHQFIGLEHARLSFVEFSRQARTKGSRLHYALRLQMSWLKAKRRAMRQINAGDLPTECTSAEAISATSDELADRWLRRIQARHALRRVSRRRRAILRVGIPRKGPDK